MAYTGNVIFLNGVIALARAQLRLEGDSEVYYGQRTALLSVHHTTYVDYVRGSDIEVHSYQNGLLLCRLRPQGTWYAPEGPYEQQQFRERLLLKLEEVS